MTQSGYKKMMMPKVVDLFKKYLVVATVAKELKVPPRFVNECLKTHFHESSMIKCRKRVEKTSGNNFTKAHASPKMMNRTKRAFEIYQKAGTLERTSKFLGVTRERVRQLLEMGTSFGLFHYDRRGEKTQKKKEVIKNITKDQAIAVLAKSGKNGLAEKFGINFGDARQVVTNYHLNTLILRKEERLKNIMKQYNAAVQHFGKHPSTKDLQGSGDTDLRQLSIDISSYLGGIDKFRKDHGIEFTHAKRTHIPKRDGKAIEFCKKHRSFKRMDLQKELETTYSTTTNIIRSLRARGIVKIVHQNGYKNAYYEVIK